MPVFTDVLVAPNETENEASREDILLMCRLHREERVSRLVVEDLRDFRKAA